MQCSAVQVENGDWRIDRKMDGSRDSARRPFMGLGRRSSKIRCRSCRFFSFFFVIVLWVASNQESTVCAPRSRVCRPTCNDGTTPPPARCMHVRGRKENVRYIYTSRNLGIGGGKIIKTLRYSRWRVNVGS